MGAKWTGYKSIEELSTMLESYNEGTLDSSPKEGKVIDPRVAYVVTTDDIKRSIPYEHIRKHRESWGELSILSETSPVANLIWDYLFFTDCSVFSPAAKAFDESRRKFKNSGIKPSYTSHIKGTKGYADFWREEFDRIINGYEPIIDNKPCGVRISGEYYFYLNYCRIKKIVTLPDGSKRDVLGFPDFLSMDYYYYKELEAREKPRSIGLDDSYRSNMVVLKSRRKGFSFKAAAGAVWIIAFNANARVGIASEPNSADATDAVKCARKCIPIIDHLTEYTPFGRTDPGDPARNGGWKHELLKDTKDSFSFTFGLFNTKTKEKRGRQSTIFTMSLSKDDAASGEGLNRLYFEEAGKISNLDKAWVFSRESMKAGSEKRGIIIGFGTGGEMVSSSGKRGSSRSLAMLFNNPEAAEVGAYDNIYEYKFSNKKCGYFISDMWSNFGSALNIDNVIYPGLDDNGNAIFWVAELCLNIERASKQPPVGTQEDYNRFLTQRCKTPSEALLAISPSVFNIADLIAHRNEVKSSLNGFSKFRIPGELVEKRDGSIEFVPDFEKKYTPIISMDYDRNNRAGCVLMYELPKNIGGVIPDDAYIISVDPIGKNNSGGESLISIIVMKTPKYTNMMGPEKIVATYVGRPDIRPLDFMYSTLIRFSKLYNAKITYENDNDGGILAHFAAINELRRLMPFPMFVTQKHLPTSKTLLREFGHSVASDRHKTFAEMYLSEWLDYRHSSRKGLDVDGREVTMPGKRNLDMLEDEFIIEQLINYTRAGNYDGVLALMGCIIQFQEKFFVNTNDYQDHEKAAGEIWRAFYEVYMDDEGVYDDVYSVQWDKRIGKKNIGKGYNEDNDEGDIDISDAIREIGYDIDD